MAGATALSKNYPTYRPDEGTPGYTCISINEEVVHGVPGPRTLKDGDDVTLDIALSLDGYSPESTVSRWWCAWPGHAGVLDVTRESLDLALTNMRPGRRWSDEVDLGGVHDQQVRLRVVKEKVFVGLHHFPSGNPR